MHLATEFQYPMFDHSEVILLTNQQTDAAENILLAMLRYAGG